MKVFLHGLLLYGFFLKSFLWGESFSKPREFSEFGSNLGEQQLVEVVRPWVGVTPEELVPGAIVLGSLKNRTYAPAENIVPDPPPLEPLKKESVKVPEKKKAPVELPENKNFPLEIRGDPIPVERSAHGWVGPLPHELAPRAIPLGSLANRRKITRSHYAKPRPAPRDSKPIPSKVQPPALQSQAESVQPRGEVSPPSPQTQRNNRPSI